MLCEEKLSVLMAPSGIHDVRVDDAERAESVLRVYGLRAVVQGDILRIEVPASQTIGEVICYLVQHGVRVVFSSSYGGRPCCALSGVFSFGTAVSWASAWHHYALF